MIGGVFLQPISQHMDLQERNQCCHEGIHHFFLQLQAIPILNEAIRGLYTFVNDRIVTYCNSIADHPHKLSCMDVAVLIHSLWGYPEFQSCVPPMLRNAIQYQWTAQKCRRQCLCTKQTLWKVSLNDDSLIHLFLPSPMPKHHFVVNSVPTVELFKILCLPR